MPVKESDEDPQHSAFGPVSALLITGTSHTGKSTLAARLGATLGWPVVSTDALARHPGRPRPIPRPHVAEMYERLSVETLHTLLLHHHANMVPVVRQALRQRPVIVEGNALRPELYAPDLAPGARMACLTAPDDVLRARIRASSDWATRTPRHKAQIDAFIARSLCDNAALASSAQRYTVTVFDTASDGSLDLTLPDFHALQP